MADLTSYSAVRSNLLVKIEVAQYRTTSSASYTAQDLLFTDSPDTETYNSDSYVPLGKLLNVTESNSEIRPSADGMTVSISGVPTNAVAEVLYSKIKGSPIYVYRRYRTVAGTVLDTQKFFVGTVENYSIQEELFVEERSSSSIILFECTNTATFLGRQLAGRKTNPQSEQKFFSADTAMNRVPTLKNTKFNFGAP